MTDNSYSGAGFVTLIRETAEVMQWALDEVNETGAVLHFPMPSGRTQVLRILRFDGTLEFSVQSMAVFESEENVPHYLSTVLLKVNARHKIGFWCIQEIEKKLVFSVMHNAELEHLDRQYLVNIVGVLTEQCDQFEATLIKVLEKGK
jgi:hypothetical protein